MNWPMPKPGTTVTEAELKSLGVDPACPVGRRVPGPYLDVRCGDNRYQRYTSGCVMVSFGYYSPAQTRLREIAAQVIAENFRAAFPQHLFLSKEPTHENR